MKRILERAPGRWLLSVLAMLLFAAAPAHAQFTQLQVLLPGESPAPGTTLGKTGAPDAQTVGESFTVLVRACDADWNTVTSVTDQVILTSTDASATLPGPATLVNGERQFTVTLNAAGNFTFTADDNTDTTIPDATSATVPSFLLNGFEFARINQKNQYAGTPMTITLDAIDPSGDPVPGFSGQVRLRQITSFGEGRISPEFIELVDGSWTGSVTLYRADETAINRGNVNILAELVIDPTKNGTSDPFTVHPGTFSRVQIVVPGEDPLPGSQAGVSGSPASQGAGQAFTVEVWATDDYWNPVPSADAVRITSPDGAASTPVNLTLAGGYASGVLSLGTVGTQTLTVTDQTNGSIQPMTSAGIQVTPSSAQQFLISALPSSVTAGQAVPVTLTAADASGNLVPTFNGDARLSANTGPGSITPEQVTFVNGSWSGDMVFRGAGGSVSFTVSDFSTPPHTGTSAPFTVNPGPVAGLQVLPAGQTPAGGTASGVVGQPTPQNAGTAFNLTVRAVDAFWNRVPGVNHVVALSSTDLFAGMPAEITLANGEAILPVTLYKAGTQTITASDVDDPSVSEHTSSGIQVDSGAYARMVLIAPGEVLSPGAEEGRSGAATDQSINFAFTVRVFATDNWYNPVQGVNDIVRITSNDPLAQLPADTPMTDGVAFLSVRLSTGGFQQITASNVSSPSITSSTTQVRAISSGFHLEAEVVPTTVRAGEPFNLTVKVTNDAGSVIQEFNSSVTVEVQNANSQLPGAGTLLTTEFQLLQGQRTVSQTYTYAETIVLTVRDDAGNAPAVSEPITVNPGQPAAIALTSDPSWVRGGRHATLSARLVDAFDNGVPGEIMVFSMQAGGGSVTPIDNTTDDTGVATADFLAPRDPQVSRVRAVAGPVTTEIDLETALVDPNAPGGTVTNYPNPFHPGQAPTTIAYKLDDPADVTMRLFTLSGDLVLTRTYGRGGPGGLAGLNEITWDGRNGEGEFVATGGYILDILAQGTGETQYRMRRKIGVVR